ncbi:MAG: organic solute transporter Ostalpha-domain-containing protein [Piptocephalis tieghemiana]|nr:MAG: organic solute transporter Ostalpha-domain-containing protein [Piptocephalis tieghemiana]
MATDAAVCDLSLSLPQKRLADIFAFDSGIAITWFLSALALLIASIIALVSASRHLMSYNLPVHQRPIVRILLMIPIYGTLSWASLYFTRWAVYLVAIRDVYEAYTIASFFYLLLMYVGETPREQMRAIRAHTKPVRLFVPCCCFHIQPRSRHLLQVIKGGILQVIVLKPLCSLVAVITQALGVYCPDRVSLSHAKFWISIVGMNSLILCMVFLVTFYLVVRSDIRHHSPVAKFIGFKAIIFLSLWQTVVITICIGEFGAPASVGLAAPELINLLTCALICLEMMFFALLQAYSFSPQPYQALLPAKSRSLVMALLHAMNPMDLLKELAYGIRYIRWAWGGPLPQTHSDVESLRSPDVAYFVETNAFMDKEDAKPAYDRSSKILHETQMYQPKYMSPPEKPSLSYYP